MKHKVTRIQQAGSSTVTSLQVLHAGTTTPVTGSIPAGTMVDFTWVVDRAHSNAVWLVRLNPKGTAWLEDLGTHAKWTIGADNVGLPGDDPEGPNGPAGLQYTTPGNNQLPSKLTIPIRQPGTYRLYAGLVGYGPNGEDMNAENWCPDASTKEVTVKVGPDPVGMLVFGNPSPLPGTLVELKVLVTPYYGNHVSLRVDPPTPDNARTIDLDANGNATLFIKAPATVGVFTYQLLVDDKPSGDPARLTTHAVEVPQVVTMEFDDKFPDHNAQLVQLKILVRPHSAGNKISLSVDPKTPDDGREVVLDDNGGATLYVASPNIPVPYRYTPYTYRLTVDGVANRAQAQLTPGPYFLQDDYTIEIDDGLPVIGTKVQGKARILLSKDGNYTFSGYIKAIGPPLVGPVADANVRIYVAVLDSPMANKYAFAQITHLNGLLSSGQPDYVWKDNGQELQIARNWGNLLKARAEGVKTQWIANTKTDFGAWVASLGGGLISVAPVGTGGDSTGSSS